MSLRRRLAASALLAATVCGGAFYASRHVAPHAAASAPAASASEAVRMPHERWSPGSAYVYDLAWDTSATIRTQGIVVETHQQTLSGAGALRGQLTLRCLGMKDGAALLAASVSNLSTHSIRVMDSDPLADPQTSAATFDGREAIVEIDPTGAVRAIHADAQAPELFVFVMRKLLTHLTVTLPEGDHGAEWQATEPGPSGRARAQYTQSGAQVTRTRDVYETLDALPPKAAAGHREELASTARIDVDEGGTLASIDDHESLAVRVASSDGPPALVSTSAFTITHVRTDHFDAPTSVTLDPSRMIAWHPGEADDAAMKTSQHSLEQLAGSMTLKSLQGEIEVYGVGGTPPKTFAVQATAFLRLHPEACDELAHSFSDDALGIRGREMVTDLLASTGHPRAQAALRSVLASPAAHADAASYDRMLQRFSFVKHPDGESVAMLRDVYAKSREAAHTDDARAAAYALGSAASNLARTGDAAAAREATQALVRDLKAAKSPAEKRGLLGALGNAGLAEPAAIVASYAKDEDTAVRAEAANALRRVDTPEARETLMDLVDDPEASVGKAAIGALGDQPLSNGDVAAVASLVTKGAAPQALDSRLVTFFASHATPSEAVIPAIDAMIARTHDDYRLTARLEALRAQVLGMKDGTGGSAL